MGEISQPRPVLLILAAFSRYEEALAWAAESTSNAWGPVALSSDAFSFDDTHYYDKTMGPGLRKKFFAFEKLVDATELAMIKRTANEMEQRFRDTVPGPEVRPLNLDPGYITEAKLVLATTKDRDHRIYLSDGIYAEVTLHFHSGKWRTREWTYPDYARSEYHEFFTRCREFLRQRYRRDFAK